MINHKELWGIEMTNCEKTALGQPYEPCTCYIHDRVAELLDVDSTNPAGYKTAATKAKIQAAKPPIPPRPRKPKIPTSKQVEEEIAEFIKPRAIRGGTGKPVQYMGDDGQWITLTKPEDYFHGFTGSRRPIGSTGPSFLGGSAGSYGYRGYTSSTGPR